MTLPVDEIGAPYPLAAAFLFAENNRFPVDVIALQECDVMFIPKETIEAKMRECPQYMRGFMAFNANRMQYISERLKIFAQKGIKGKIVYYILSRERDGEFKLGRSIASLAEYVWNLCAQRINFTGWFPGTARVWILQWATLTYFCCFTEPGQYWQPLPFPSSCARAGAPPLADWLE